jgi:hypothetical protein
MPSPPPHYSFIGQSFSTKIENLMDFLLVLRLIIRFQRPVPHRVKVI